MRVSKERLYIFSYFIGMILLGAMLLMLPAAWDGMSRLEFVDAIFTSTSAVCVTGLITVDTARFSVFGKIVILLLIQFGGLGLVTFATIYVAMPRRKLSLVSRGLIQDYYIDSIESNPKKIVRAIMLFTLAIELAGALLLFFSLEGDDPARRAFDAVFHAVSAFCNAGFSTYPDSLERYVSNPAVNAIIAGLVVSGGLGFLVLQDVFRLVRGRRKRLAYHSTMVLRVTLALVLAGGLLFLALEWDGAFAGLEAGEKAMASLFAAVTPRTAGFDTINPARFSMPSLLLMMMLMFVGASPASTGGGIKTTTFFVLFSVAFRGVDETNGSLVVKGRSVHPNMIARAVGVVGKALAVVLVSISMLMLLERGLGEASVRFTHVVFEAISAFGTVGLSLGLTPTFTAASKIVIILTMFTGRIGLFTMAIPLPSKQIERYADFPHAEMLIG